MTIKGEMLIGAAAVLGSGGEFRAQAAASSRELDPVFRCAAPHELERACALAHSAFDVYRETDLATRGRFLDAIANHLENSSASIIERCTLESGLPQARVVGELGRTCNQLRLFSSVVRDGSFLEVRVDPASPDRKPMARPDLRLRNIPLGPVAVFAASNFPLAFSVAGGDTASALAAGCPVIVKAHHAHPGTSELVGRAIQKAVIDCSLPEGVFSLLFGSGTEIGQALVAHPAVKAVGFTGSRSGGMALATVAQRRQQPIPVYAEMSSINPVILLPNALAARSEAIAQDFVAALTLGAGQFCTNPGVVLAMESPALHRFLEAVAAALAKVPAMTMLTRGIYDSYCGGVATLSQHPAVTPVAQGMSGDAGRGQAGLFLTSAAAFCNDHRLQHEVFGATSLIVKCPDVHSMRDVIEQLEGQLTISVHADDADLDEFRKLMPTLERQAGRIVCNGFGTGVEVSHAMVHGGPYPATSDARTTSVGSLAIRRFLRPVCYQSIPDALLPPALQASNPWRVSRLIDGVMQGS